MKEIKLIHWAIGIVFSLLLLAITQWAALPQRVAGPSPGAGTLPLPEETLPVLEQNERFNTAELPDAADHRPSEFQESPQELEEKPSQKSETEELAKF